MDHNDPKSQMENLMNTNLNTNINNNAVNLTDPVLHENETILTGEAAQEFLQNNEIVPIPADWVEPTAHVSAPPVAKTVTQNTYPFYTKSQIKEKLATDFDFACSAVCVLYTLQTNEERAVGAASGKDKRGFMSSHVVRGSKLANKIANNEVLNAAEKQQVFDIAKCYSKQIARYHREVMMREHPELAEIGKAYFR
jgi:hypothetical protein